MLTGVLLLISWWLMQSASAQGLVDPNCNFDTELNPSTTYYVYNPEYPYRYRESRTCRWTLKHNHYIHMSCNTFELPWSYNCTRDKLTVKVNDSTTHTYCGNGSFNITSVGTMVVKLTVPGWTSGGRFLCEVTSERKQDSENCQCGWKNPTRIVGGTNTGVNEFPMMAGLVDINYRSIYCGGTIISTTYVVTAAHCVEGRNIGDLGVLVGEHDIKSGTETNVTQLLKIYKRQIHPQYQRGGDLYDIALVKTQSEIIFSSRVGPACLPFQHEHDSFGGNYVQLLGWGSTEFGGPPSDVLQKVTVSVLTNLECSRIYRNISTDRICTYAENKDSCQMDSGGPVLWQNPTSRRVVLTAVIVQGAQCGVTAGINTRVGAYMDWILSTTTETTFCNVE